MTIIERIKELVADDEPLLTMDGFDDAVVGLLERFGSPPIVLYDRAKVIEILLADGLSNEDAEEYFNFNIVGAWVGDSTPGFVIYP